MKGIGYLNFGFLFPVFITFSFFPGKSDIIFFKPKCIVMQDSIAGDSSSLNFWKGTWDATWEEDGKIQKGRNIIKAEMNGKVIQEAFTIFSGANKGYKGHSVSVFDKTADRWKQTWVDTDGNYLDFTGYKKGNDFYFERSYTGKKGKFVRQRMRFYNISSKSFTWDWEQSVDNNPWSLAWRINYQRAK